MIKKRVLLLSNFHIQAYHIQRNKVYRDVKVDLEDDYSSALDAFLCKDTHSPVYIIVNIQEEEYKVEKLPHTRGRDRALLMQRKLSQLFRDSSFGAYRVIGRETTGRKDDRVLFHALPFVRALDNIIEQIHEKAIPLAGIYSEPLLIKSCLSTAIPKGNFLILTEVDNNAKGKLSFRQCFYKDGELSLSRISTFSNDDDSAFLNDLIDDLESSHHYLTSHHAMGYNETIQTLVLSSAKTLHQLGGLNLPKDYAVQYASISSMASVLKLRNISDDDYFDDVLAGHVCKSILDTKSHYHSDKTRHHIRHHNIRWGLAWGSAAVVLSALTAISTLWGSAKSIELNNQSLRQHIALEEQRLQREERTIPNFEHEPYAIEASVKNYHHVATRVLEPIVMLRHVAYALSPFPDFSVQGLSWEKQQAQNGEVVVDLAALDPITQMPMQQAPSEQQINRYQVSIDIVDQGYPSSLRERLHRIEEFSARLNSTERVLDLNVTRWPVNLAHDTSIEGSLSQVAEAATETQQRSAFSVSFTLSNTIGEQP